MKNIILLLLLFILLTGCSRPMNMNTVLDEANFTGIVEEVNNQSVLVRVNENEEEIKSSDLIKVSLDVEIKDSMKNFSIGDEVCVYYDGNIAESYPAQVNRVYAIILVNGE